MFSNLTKAAAAAAEKERNMTNKEIILSFIDEVFNGWDKSKIDKYVREDYKQHNPTVENGREGFKKFCDHFLAMQPHMHVRMAIEDGDIVAVFFKCTFGAHDHVAKVCDIYRLEDGMLVEHWDILQQLNPDEVPVNENGHF